MSRNRLIFYIIFALFHVGAFIFTLLIQDFSFLTKIYGYISLFKYVTFFGIVLIITDVIWSWIINRDAQKEKDALTHELNLLKAKLFDIQEATRESQQPKTPKG